ncbi:hypothetical protein Fmac_014098 [Flemingia macrophylla]|uniref:Translocation protein SEC62 n=1 Tax=Flemingia macrophylla TaxID=520843 RepID=A0ABD1MCS9_9FABA
MKKSSGGAADKKRLRRSSAADPTSDAPPRIGFLPSLSFSFQFHSFPSWKTKIAEASDSAVVQLLLPFDPVDPFGKQAAKKDVYQVFAEKVRDHKDLVSRWAVLQETRVEYFRGKDFVSFLKTHPEVKDILESDRNLETEEIAGTLLQKIFCCDVTVSLNTDLFDQCFPFNSPQAVDQTLFLFCYGVGWLGFSCLMLLLFSGSSIFRERCLFCMDICKTPSTLADASRNVLACVYIGYLFIPCVSSSLQAINTLLVCWDPFPNSLSAFGSAIFGALYILLGKRIWFFPNILAEEATLRELFRFWPKKDEEEKPKWTTRLFYAVGAVLFILLLRHHAPDEAARARYQKRVSNIIDDVLEWSPSLALSGMMDKQQNVANATGSTADASTSGPEDAVPPANDDDAKTLTEQFNNTEEVTKDVDEEKHHD